MLKLYSTDDKKFRNYSDTVHTLDVSETFQSDKNILSIFDRGIDNRANPCKTVSAPTFRITELTGHFCFDFDIPDSPEGLIAKNRLCRQRRTEIRQKAHIQLNKLLFPLFPTVDTGMKRT
jgi:hypothetical protein